MNVVVEGTEVISNFLSSKLEALSPVPLGKVTASNCTISPVDAPCAEEVVIVTVVEVLVVAIVDDVRELLIGVISKS